MVYGVGCRVQGSGSGLGFKVEGVERRVRGFGFRVGV